MSDTPRPATISELVDVAVAANGAEPLFSHRPGRVRVETRSYAEIGELTLRLATGLVRAVPAGGRLAVQGAPSPALASLYLAAARARIALVPLDLRMGAEAVERIIEVATPDAVLLAPGATVDVLTVPPLARLQILDLDELAAGEFDDALLTERGAPEPDDVYEIVFTSGTTGAPKGVVLTHRNLLTSVERMRATIPEQRHRLISILPLSHIMEQATLLFGLATGSQTEYLGSLRPDVFAAAMRELRVTTLICVPQLLALLAESVEREAAKRSGGPAILRATTRLAALLPNGARRRLFAKVHAHLGGELRYVISAAAYLQPALQVFWERLGLTVLQGYGATEAGLLTTTFPGRAPAGSVGWVLPPVEIRIAPDDEIQVKGPSVTAGYDRNSDANAAAFTDDGWYRTGDAGKLGPDGRLTLIGRTRTMFVMPSGFNVFPEDIEAVFASEGFVEPVAFEASPGRIEVAVIAGRALRGQTGDDEAAAITAAMKRANKRLGDAQRVAAWRAYPDADFPRTHTLKVQRAKLTERLRG